MYLTTKERGIKYRLLQTAKPFIYEQSDKIQENNLYLSYKVFNGCYATYAIYDKSKQINIFYTHKMSIIKKRFNIIINNNETTTGN